MTGGRIRRRLHDMPMLQFAGALVAIAFALASPLTTPLGHPGDAAFSRMYVAIAVILVAGGAAGAFVARRVSRAVFLPEIRRLADEASFRGAPPRPWSFNAVQLLMVAVLLLLAGEFTLLSQQQGEVGPWSWRGPIALVLSEAIYLAWQCEGLALKSELQYIARRWDRLKRLDRHKPPAQAGGAGQPVRFPPAFPSPPVLDAAWAEHIRSLLSELGQHGFDVTAPAPSPYVAPPSGSAASPRHGTHKH